MADSIGIPQYSRGNRIFGTATLSVVGAAVLSIIASGCSGAKVADQPTVAFYQGAAKSQNFTREASVGVPSEQVAAVVSVAPEGRPVPGVVPEERGVAQAMSPALGPPAPDAPLAGATAGGGFPTPDAPLAGATAGGGLPEVAPQPVGPVQESAGAVPAAPAGTAPADVEGLADALAPPPPPPLGVTPRFDIVAQRTNDRADRVVTYYVVIDPINPGADSFKAAVKQVVAALAVTNGGPTFSAVFWDLLAAAQTEIGYRSSPDLFSEELLEAREAFNSQHLVANYVGGVPAINELPSYALLWFPDTRVENPVVGRWVGAEVWKP